MMTICESRDESEMDGRCVRRYLDMLDIYDGLLEFSYLNRV